MDSSEHLLGLSRDNILSVGHYSKAEGQTVVGGGSESNEDQLVSSVDSCRLSLDKLPRLVL